MSDDSSLLEYNEATMESNGSMIPIKLKLSDQGVAFRNINTGKSEHLSVSDIEVVNWQRLAGNYGVRIFTQNGNLYRFGGFKESEQPRLEKFFKHQCKKTMTDKEFSVKGWNYGTVKFQGSSMSFDVSSVPSFEIPVNNVSGCTTGKHEVTLEFHQQDDAPVALIEMRFHIPPSELAGENLLEDFKERVMAKASIITATGDALAIFRQVHCLTPRGRYDMKFYPTFIQLHGKTFDFKISTNIILRLFLLPHIDNRQHFFVVSLDPPIKQGQTRYPHLIFLFSNDNTDYVELPLSEKELKEKYEGRLQKEMTGPVFEIIGKLIKGISNRKIITPGLFLGHSRTPAIGCSYKAAAGYLYPLERGFIYVHKPPVHIRFDEINSINFARSESTTRSFDFEINLRNGTTCIFSSIEKREYDKLYDFVSNKKLRIKNRNKMDAVSHDDHFSDSDREPDHYMNRVRAEAKERQEVGDDSEDESEDEDFNPDEEGSDVAEEYDSNASDTSDSEESGGSDSEKKKKEKKHKKAKTVSEAPRKPRKPKKEKDANKPKRPQSAYFLWLNEHREKIKTKNPGAAITEISKIAGHMWKEVKDKSEWEEKAKEAKKEYEAAMKEYNTSGGVSIKGSKGSPAKKQKTYLSPTKSVGAGDSFKSKEYIEEDSSSEDSDDKPLKPKKVKREVKDEKKDSEEEEEEEAGSEATTEEESD